MLSYFGFYDTTPGLTPDAPSASPSPKLGERRERPRPQATRPASPRGRTDEKRAASRI